MMTRTRRRTWRFGLRARIILPVVGICLLLCVGGGCLVRKSQQQQSQEHIRVRATAIANGIVHLAETTSDEVLLQRFVTAMSDEQDVKLIVVAAGSPPVVVAGSRTDWVGRSARGLPDPQHTSRDLFRAIESGQPFSEFHQDKEHSAAFTFPLKTRMGSANPSALTSGAVMMHLVGRPHLRHEATSTARLVWTLCSTTALAAIVTFAWLSIGVLRPVKAISKVARRTAKGDFSARVDSRRTDELGRLGADVDAMLDELVRREAEEREIQEAFVCSQRQMEDALAELACTNFALDQQAIVATTDLSGKITYVNDKFCEISQYSRQELIGRTHRIVNSGHHTPAFWREMWRTIGAGEVWHEEVCNRAKDRSLYWVDTTIVPYKNQDGKTTKYVAIRADITDRKSMAEELIVSQERFELAVRGSSDGLWDWNIATNEVYYSPRFKRLLGYGDDEFPNHLDSFAHHLHPDDSQDTWSAVHKHLNLGETYDVTYRLRTKDDTWRWFRAKGMATRSAVGTPRRMAGSLSDITELKEIEEQLSREALYDHLTGLPNRALLLDRLQCTLDGQVRTTTGYALMFLDLDGFKLVNDRWGHEAGDELLRQIAVRLRENVRPVDAVGRAARGNVSARMGGDEFVVLLQGLAQPKDALEVAKRLMSSLNQSYQLGPREIVSTASIGIVLGDSRYHRADDILRDADAAMYEAKHRGKGHFVVFDPSSRKDDELERGGAGERRSPIVC